jgi:hypothetical protein
MAGKGYYFVGPNQTYPEIQDAVQALIDDQGTDDFVSEQRIIVAENGVYAPFRLESDALKPTSAARLTIGAALGIQPIISGKKAPSKRGLGGLIGNNIPYVTVERLFFRDLDRGLVVGVNCHRSIVNQCTFLSCGNFGVWVYQADECLISNSILINHEHGIVASKPRSIAIIHNTIFNDIGISKQPTWLVYCDLQDDRGQGIENTGQLTCVNNILMSQGGGGGLLIYEKDVPFLDLNYNCWWMPGESRFVEVREPRPDGTVAQDTIRDLALWRLRSGQDYNSIVHEPGFIKPSSNSAGATIDLKLLKTSYLIKKGKLLCGDPSNDLPTYVEDSYLCRDFNGKERTSQPTIGANEVIASNSFYGHQIFADIDTESDDALICGDQWASFDRVAGHYASAVPLWLPKVKTGYFYWRDHEYYLYAKKGGYRLTDFVETHLPLSNLIEPSRLQVVLSGVDVTDTATWRVDGFTFVLHHNGLNVDSLFSEVELYGDTKVWDPTQQGFNYKRTKHRWHLIEGVQKYVFPTDPVEGAPIVVTDMTIQGTDPDWIAMDFWAEQKPDGVELKFGTTNRWQNPQFDYDLEDYRYTGDVQLQEAGIIDARIFEPLAGIQALLMSSGDTGNYISQMHPADPGSAYFISAYGATLSSVNTGSIGLAVDFYDYLQHPISSTEVYRFSIPGTGGNTGDAYEYFRFGIGLWAEPDDTYGRPLPDVVLANTGIQIPLDTAYMSFRILPDTGEDMAITCIQLEQGYAPTRYTRLPKSEDLTVEYEQSDLGFYTVTDLSIHPIRNTNHSGFLTILPVPTHEWDSTAPVGSTTLTDDWVAGRTGELPWARIDGLTKLKQVEEIRSEAIQQPETLAPDPSTHYPSTIQVTPNQILARQGGDGEDFVVEVLDRFRNPYQHERANIYIADPTGEFPGYLSRGIWNFYTHLGQAVAVDLDEAGAQTFRWIPPEQEDIEYRGDAPAFYGADTYINTRYRVNPTNHGNPVVRNQFGDLISTEGAHLTSEIFGFAEPDSTIVNLDWYPVPGYINVYSDETGGFTKRFNETLFLPVGEYEFYTDYENGRLVLQAGWDSPVRAVYKPRLVWRDPNYERRLYFSDQLSDVLTGDIAVQYDATIDILIEVPSPTGQIDVGPVWLTVPAIAQHGDI